MLRKKFIALTLLKSMKIDMKVDNRGRLRRLLDLRNLWKTNLSVDRLQICQSRCKWTCACKCKSESAQSVQGDKMPQHFSDLEGVLMINGLQIYISCLTNVYHCVPMVLSVMNMLY